MKKRSALAALFGVALTCGAPVFAAETPVEVIVAGTAHQALFAMDFDGDRGVAVGAAGEVQVTADGGKYTVYTTDSGTGPVVESTYKRPAMPAKGLPN